jgi:hypothetical protein
MTTTSTVRSRDKVNRMGLEMQCAYAKALHGAFSDTEIRELLIRKV